MKKKAALATLAMLPLGVVNAHADGDIGIVTINYLNVRNEPTAESSIAFVAKKDDKVLIKDSSNGWYKIKAESGQEGWASSKYIAKSNSDSLRTSTNKEKQVISNSLNMRNGAGTSYRVITVLKKGQKVEVISESNGWSKIKYDGRLGYVSSSYLGDVSNSTNKSKTKQVNTTSLNVRSGPNTSYGLLGKLPKGSKVEVISESNGWSKIKYNGKDAYVSSMCLSDVSQSNSDNSSQSNDKKNTDKVVNTASLNVRSGPGSTYSKLGKVYKGSKVTVLSESSGWAKINFNNKEAFVVGNYLSTSADTSNNNSNSNSDNSSNSNGNNSSSSGQVNGMSGISGAKIDYKSLSYTLESHISKQVEKAASGGNVIAPSNRKSTPSPEFSTFSAQRTSSFVNASSSDIEYYLNPKNFTNTTKGMMQFLKINSYRDGISESSLNSYLNGLSSSVFKNQGAAFINAAKKYNIDVVYLVSHAMWETAYGKSTLAQGQTLTSYKGQPLSKPVKVYNFFGIGAIDKSANVSGAEAAYSNGWTSVEATIDGSAKWISQNYVNSSKYNQNTIYKMKWNYDYTWHQYATDVNWANGISGIMENLIGLYGGGSSLVFEVPQYK
ncbi:TPA: N-acetylglucosaminidase [Clostridioides difficile]|nr:N-acetylglucosaminidase [Clostridioides difficile]